MEPPEFAEQFTITTPVGQRPVGFARHGEPVTEQQFIRDCWDAGVDPFVTVGLCRRVVAEPSR